MLRYITATLNYQTRLKYNVLYLLDISDFIRDLTFFDIIINYVIHRRYSEHIHAHAHAR